jgi:pyruvate dehydrogenase E2 component (dihydrolipoamide acetyltransferase)
MAERTTASWKSTPHFYLVREVDASKLVQWKDELAAEVQDQEAGKLTFTDLLLKVLAFSLRKHPRLTSTWENGTIHMNNEINIGLAVAVDDGLVAPVIHQADQLPLGQLAKARKDLVERAQSRKLRPSDLEGGTFTLTNLGMYNIDTFNAIINSPQAAILAVGRIADRVIAVNGEPAVRPTIILSLSCDHRLVDGARGAQFLDELTKLIENPWRLIV